MPSVNNQTQFNAYVQILKADAKIDNNFTRDDHMKQDYNAALPLIGSAQDSLTLADAFDKPWQGTRSSHDKMMRTAYEKGLALATTPDQVGAIMQDAGKRMDNAGSIRTEGEARMRSLAGLPPAPPIKHSFWRTPLVIGGCIALATCAVGAGIGLGMMFI